MVKDVAASIALAAVLGVFVDVSFANEAIQGEVLTVFASLYSLKLLPFFLQGSLLKDDWICGVDPSC